MGACMSARSVVVHVYTIIDAEEDPLFAMMALPFGVTGVYITSVVVGGKEYVYDAHRPAQAGAPAAEERPEGAPAPPAAATAPTPERPGGVRSYAPRPRAPASKPPPDLYGADAVRGMKGVVEMGHTTKSRKEIEAILAELRATYTGEAYNLATRNPNHFSAELCARLGAQKQFPPWLNNASAVGQALGLPLDAPVSEIARAATAEAQAERRREQEARSRAQRQPARGGGPLSWLAQRPQQQPRAAASDAEAEAANALAVGMLIGGAAALMAIAATAEAELEAERQGGRGPAGQQSRFVPIAVVPPGQRQQQQGQQPRRAAGGGNGGLFGGGGLFSGGGGGGGAGTAGARQQQQPPPRFEEVHE